MKFSVQHAAEILHQTPYVLSRMLGDLSPEWTQSSGNSEDWAPYDVVGHLIHGEETDWIPRVEMIIAQGETAAFAVFDRFAQFENSRGKTIKDLLGEFAQLRNANLEKLLGWQLAEDQLRLKGRHPELGEVTLEQLLATWTVHDLNHIRQIATYMARKLESEVGPWKEYLAILK